MAIVSSLSQASCSQFTLFIALRQNEHQLHPVSKSTVTWLTVTCVESGQDCHVMGMAEIKKTLMSFQMFTLPAPTACSKPSQESGPSGCFEVTQSAVHTLFPKSPRADAHAASCRPWNHLSIGIHARTCFFPDASYRNLLKG